MNSASSGGQRREEESADYQVESSQTHDEQFKKSGRCRRRDHGSFCRGRAWGGRDEQILARQPLSQVFNFEPDIFSTFPNILHFSQKSLSFFVDISGAESPGPPPALTRSTFISPSSTYPSFYQVPSHILNFNTLQKPSLKILASLLLF